MSRLMMDVEIYVFDDGLFKELTIESGHLYIVMYLDGGQSYEVADRLETIAEGESFELVDGQDSLTIEGEWMRVRINLNGVRGVLDRQAVREIAHDLRVGWGGCE